MGDMTFDIGPGATKRIAPKRCQGMGVAVDVGRGVKVKVGRGVSDGNSVGMDAMAVSVPEAFTALAVNAITVGRYSGG